MLAEVHAREIEIEYDKIKLLTNEKYENELEMNNLLMLLEDYKTDLKFMTDIKLKIEY